MGIALLLFWPVAFCDVTDGWRLQKRHQRLMISLAGILAELVLAGLALFLWGITQEGVLHSMAFVISSVTVISTLVMNLNPAIRFVWSLLDFGMSFLQARQAENQMHILGVQMQRARQNLALSVTQSYLQAVIAEKALVDAQYLMQRSQDRLASLQKHIKNKTVSEMEGLEREKTLVQMQIKLRGFERQAKNARSELGRRMGLAPGTSFKFASFKVPANLPESMNVDLPAFEAEALASRPELLEEDLRERISADEARASLLKMFPNVNITGSRDFDNNKYILNEHWYEAAVQSAWSLFSLPQRLKERQAARKRVELIKQRRMVMAIAILTQLRLAVVDYQDAVGNIKLVKNLSSVQDRLLAAAKKHGKEGAAGEDLLLEKESEALFGHIRYLTAYADMVIAAQRIQNTLGREPGRKGPSQVSTKEIRDGSKIAEKNVPLQDTPTGVQ